MGDGLPSSDGLTRAEVWKLLDTYQSQWKERFDRHANGLDRNTSAMTDGFTSMRQIMERDADIVQLIANRVLTIETERGIEKQIAARQGAIFGSVAAGLIIAAIEAVKRLFK